MHIEGYISIDKFSMSKSNYYTIYIDGKSIREYIEDNVSESDIEYIESGFGEKHYHIPNCQLKIYYSDRECNLADAQNGFIKSLYGDIEGHGSYYGYSEYTILGFDLETLSIGGHDLINELKTHEGNYVHILINE